MLEVRGSQVRIGIEAPADVRIFREEVYRASQNAKGDDGAAPMRRAKAGRADEAAAAGGRGEESSAASSV